MIKKYNLFSCQCGCGKIDWVESTNGEWVKWENVEELLDKIIDSVTDHWHENNVNGDLQKWLGLNKDEYFKYVLKIKGEIK